MKPKTLNKEDFALSMDFPSYDALLTASTELTPHNTDATSYFVTPLANGRFAAWDDFELAADRVGQFTTHNEAARFQIAGCQALYEDFHRECLEETDLTVEVSENHDGDGNIIGFCLSLDSDGRSHGADEKFGAW